MYSYKLFVYSLILSIFMIIILGCAETNDTNQPQLESLTFNDLISISVELAWSDDYDSASLYKRLIPTAFAALPPDYQPHYQLNLIFDHHSQSISDTYKSFTGTDSSDMIISTLTRSSHIYNQIRQYMEGTYICDIAVEIEGWAGPAQPTITFIASDTSMSGIRFYGDESAMIGESELCSEDFGDYLLSLKNDRN